MTYLKVAETAQWITKVKEIQINEKSKPIESFNYV